jgi:hypothetical protein
MATAIAVVCRKSTTNQPELDKHEFVPKSAAAFRFAGRATA